MTKIKYCGHCGKEMDSTGDNHFLRRKFCSLRCSASQPKPSLRAKDLPKYKMCQGCGEKILRRDGEKPTDWRARKYCDLPCRLKHNIGEDHNRARLSDSDVLNIRADKRLQRVIGEKYGITQEMVSAIKRRVRWSHLP